MSIAEHDPEKLNPANKGMLSMSHDQLHDFAATPEKNLPEHANSKNVYAKKYKGIFGKKK